MKIDRVVENLETSPSTIAIGPCASARLNGDEDNVHEGPTLQSNSRSGCGVVTVYMALSRAIFSWLSSNIKKLESRISGVGAEFSLCVKCPLKNGSSTEARLPEMLLKGRPQSYLL